MIMNLFAYMGENLELDSDYDKVHKTLAKLRISYPSELAAITYIDINKVNRILNYFIHEGAMNWVKLNPEYVPDKLLPRLQHFWNKGIMGYNAFIRMNWVECNDKLYWGDKEKYKSSKVEEESVS